jgi:hypothetical protein
VFPDRLTYCSTRFWASSMLNFRIGSTFGPMTEPRVEEIAGMTFAKMTIVVDIQGDSTSSVVRRISFGVPLLCKWPSSCERSRANCFRFKACSVVISLCSGRLRDVHLGWGTSLTDRHGGRFPRQSFGTAVLIYKTGF